MNFRGFLVISNFPKYIFYIANLTAYQASQLRMLQHGGQGDSDALLRWLIQNDDVVAQFSQVGLKTAREEYEAARRARSDGDEETTTDDYFTIDEILRQDLELMPDRFEII